MGIPQKRAIEKLGLVFNHIDNLTKLDRFTFEQMLKDSEYLDDEPTMYMVKALAYGAYQDNQNALKYFDIAMKYGDISVAKNYITYLTKTLQFKLSYKKSIELANKYDNQYLTFVARNIAYSFADIKNSSLLTEKLVKLHGNVNLDQYPYLDFSQPLTELEVFMKSSEFYTSSDNNDFAVIVSVTTSDPDVLSDMDIEIACALAENNDLSDKNVTAWFRSDESKENYAELLK